MKFDCLTLFPEMFEALNQSIIGRAKEKNLIEINLINIRDFSKDKHKKVDDTPYGGGAGMVMKADVVYDAYKSVSYNIFAIWSCKYHICLINLQNIPYILNYSLFYYFSIFI